MDTRPDPTPEGELIAAALGRLDLSIREAAKRAGISYGRWRQIVKGYQNISPGVYGEVRNAPAKTIARMAKIAGVQPGELELQGRRPDAAAILRDLLREDGEQERRLHAVPEPQPAGEPVQDGSVPISLDVVGQLVRPALIASATSIRAHAEAVLARNPAATGADIFPAEPDLAGYWDLTPSLPVAQKSTYAAIARFGRTAAQSGLLA